MILSKVTSEGGTAMHSHLMVYWYRELVKVIALHQTITVVAILLGKSHAKYQGGVIRRLDSSHGRHISI